MAIWKHDGKVLERDIKLPTPDQLRAKLNKENIVRDGRRVALRLGSELRPLDQLSQGRSISGDVIETKSIPGGTIKGADDLRSRFIKTQVASVAEVMGERYGQSVQLAENLDFVVIPHFRLPRRWGMKSTPILIWFPDKYPEVPPHGFYLSKHCRGPHIFSYNVYKDSPDLSTQGWNWYCVYPQGWKAGADPLQPDNLWTFLDVVRMSLSIDEF